MSINDKIEMLNIYINANIAPILTDFISKENINNATIISSICSREELNGYFEDDNFVMPIWYQKLKEKEKDVYNILVIDNISDISFEEQRKFTSLLKYRKVGTLELPKNCVVVITSKKVSNESISEEIFSLVSYI